jgi:hypothetical protein
MEAQLLKEEDGDDDTPFAIRSEVNTAPRVM